MPQYLTRRSFLISSTTASVLATRKRHTANAQGNTLTLTNSTPTEKMQRVLEAWELSGEQMGLSKGVSEEDISGAERHLGWALPDTVRMLYERANGYFGSLGVVNLWPLSTDDPNGLSLVAGSDKYRAWQWPTAKWRDGHDV